MTKKLQKLGGPKTAEGKKISSKNAQKSTIFTKGYLVTEDIEQKQKQFDRLSEQWHAYDPTRHIVLRTIEQASLGLERMMAIEKTIIEGVMQSLDIANEFIHMAGLIDVRASSLPSWFFVGDDGGEKKDAVLIDHIWYQASLLKAQFSDRVVPQIAQLYPELFEYVMKGQSPNASFVMVLGQRYKQSTVTLNLVELMNAIVEKYPNHLIWARDPARYQLIIDAIRAKKMQEAMDLDKTNRYATSFQNRIFKGFQMLAVMGQHEMQAVPLSSDPSQNMEAVAAIDVTKVEVDADAQDS